MSHAHHFPLAALVLVTASLALTREARADEVSTSGAAPAVDAKGPGPGPNAEPLAADAELPEEFTGINVRVGLTTERSFGDLAKDVSADSQRLGGDVSVGLSFTRHVQVAIGANIGLAIGGDLCTNTDTQQCSYITYHLNSRVELDFDSRKRGPYVSVGASWFPHGTASLKTTAGSPIASSSLSAPVGALFGLGWRIPLVGSRGTTRYSAENPVRHALDVGLQMNAVQFSTVSTDQNSDAIADAKRSLHFDIGLLVAWHFTP